jgi:hypothetical protein
VFSDDNIEGCDEEFKDFDEVRDDYSPNKNECVSELNNPNSFINAITKALQEDGVYTIKQMGSVISNGQNFIGSGIGNPISIDGAGMYGSNPNFVVCCSPSQNTCNNDDDCQYTNSSAARSHVAMSIE